MNTHRIRCKTCGWIYQYDGRWGVDLWTLMRSWIHDIGHRLKREK